MLAGNLLTVLVEGSFRILSGTVKSVWGRVMDDSVLTASGQFERLAGEVALVRVRARGPIRQAPPRA